MITDFAVSVVILGGQKRLENVTTAVTTEPYGDRNTEDISKKDTVESLNEKLFP